MSQYLPALEQRWAAEQAKLLQRIATLEQQMARVAVVAVVCTSTTRPANPAAGLLIYETDTTKLGVWSGSAWLRVTVT